MPKQVEIPGAERPRDQEIESALEKMLEHQEASVNHRRKANLYQLSARTLIAEKNMPGYRYFDGEVAYWAKPISRDSLSVKKEKGMEVARAEAEKPKANGRNKPKTKPKAGGKRQRKAKSAPPELSAS